MPNLLKLSSVAAVAAAWENTPFVHGASLRGVGSDCLGLVLGVLREVGYDFEQPPYQLTPNEQDEAALSAALESNLVRLVEPLPGAVLQFRWRGLATHLGICTERGFLHAYFPAQRVVEVPLYPIWAGRLVSVWELPD